MSENLTRRYAIKTTTNAVLGLGAAGASAYLGHQAYQCIRMSIKANFGTHSMAEIQQTAKDTGHEYYSKDCLEKAKINPATTATVQHYNEPAYI